MLSRRCTGQRACTTALVSLQSACDVASAQIICATVPGDDAEGKRSQAEATQQVPTLLSAGHAVDISTR